MQHPGYENLIQFASEGALESEIQNAKEEFINQTGDLFESDSDFEARIASFLEWYAMDRKVNNQINSTPAKLYIQHRTPELTTPELQELRNLTRTHLSVFEIKKIKGDSLKLVDILSGEKFEVTASGPLLGLENGDLIEGRIFESSGSAYLSDNIHAQPRAAKKSISKAAKQFRKQGKAEAQITMVQRVAFLRNRASRYAHLDPKQIFAELSV